MFSYISKNASTCCKFKSSYYSISKCLPKSFNSYKEVVSYLGLPDYSNKSNYKKQQLDRLKMYFDFTRLGRKFIITNVKTPKSIIPIYSLDTMREKNIAPTFKLLNNFLIVDILSKYYFSTGEKKIITTKKDLAGKLGYTNELFLKYYYSQRELADKMGISIEFVRRFFETVSKRYSSLIDTSLVQLEEYGILTYQTVFYGYDENIHSRRRLTDEEIEIYLRGVNDYFKLNSIHTMKDIYFNGRWYEFNQFIRSFMKENKCIGNISKKLEIFFNMEAIIKCLGNELGCFCSNYDEVNYLNHKFIIKQTGNFCNKKKSNGWGTIKINEEDIKSFNRLCSLLLDIEDNFEKIIYKG